MWTQTFWKQTTERAIKTFTQSLVALIGSDQIGITDFDWVTALSISAMAAAASVLSSVASSGIGSDPTTPSMVDVK